MNVQWATVMCGVATLGPIVLLQAVEGSPDWAPSAFSVNQRLCGIMAYTVVISTAAVYAMYAGMRDFELWTPHEQVNANERPKRE